MKTITISDRFNLTCPCCREPVIIQIDKYDDGKKIVTIIHKEINSINLDISEFGLEFGVCKGGEREFG